MPEQLIEIRDSKGNVIGKIEASSFPLYVTTDTTTATNKRYTLNVNYLKDPVTKERDKSRITGMQLS